MASFVREIASDILEPAPLTTLASGARSWSGTQREASSRGYAALSGLEIACRRRACHARTVQASALACGAGIGDNGTSLPAQRSPRGVVGHLGGWESHGRIEPGVARPAAVHARGPCTRARARLGFLSSKATPPGVRPVVGMVSNGTPASRSHQREPSDGTRRRRARRAASTRRGPPGPSTSLPNQRPRFHASRG